MSLLVLTALMVGQVSPEVSTQPNIVVFLCDDLGYGDLGCFGHPKIQTPALDQLAKEGARLTSLYAGAPVCSPSRAAFFSGQNPNKLGIRDWIPFESGICLPESTPTVSRRLRDAGYLTCLSGKWHLNSRFNKQETSPADFGFDHWFATQNNTKHQDPSNFVRNGQRVGLMEGHATTIVVDEAIDFIGRAGEKPFAVFVTFHAPHEQIETPEKYKGLYKDIEDPTTRDYFGSVSLIDHEVGRLVDYLDANGLRDNTIVIFTSDNGPEGLKRYPNAIHSHGSAAPLRGMKLSMFEGGIRVPGIIRWPGRIEPGTESDEPIGFYDFLPTFCAIAGIDLPESVALDGVNVLPLLDGKPIDRPVPLHWQYDEALEGPWRIALRRGKWKLLADADRKQFALFNLENDPSETRDLAAEHPEVVDRLRPELERLYVPAASGSG